MIGPQLVTPLSSELQITICWRLGNFKTNPQMSGRQLIGDSSYLLLERSEEHKHSVFQVPPKSSALVCVCVIILSKAGDCSFSCCVLQGSAGETKL